MSGRSGAPRRAEERVLRRALQTLADAWGPVVAGAEYRSPADFVLREGRWYQPRVAPPEIPQGSPKRCFGNAIYVAVVHRLAYVEGYAASIFNPGLPVHHAWNETAAGELVDVTWGTFLEGRQIGQVGVAYLGVEFSAARADDATWHGDATVLDDYNRGWPLLREPWRGETPGAEFPPSPLIPALEAARDGDLRLARILYEQAT